MNDLKFDRFAKNTEYFKLHQDTSETIGITHHATGLGKLKVKHGGHEYGIPIADIHNQCLSDWRIDRK